VDLPAEVRVPVVLDFVVCSPREVAGDQGPPGSPGKTVIRGFAARIQIYSFTSWETGGKRRKQKSACEPTVTFHLPAGSFV
jgi:hypothetical protein